MSTYQVYPAYKPSNIEWLGDVPQHWSVIPIKRLTLVKRGASPRPIDDPKYFDDDGEYAWVRISDVTASDRYLEQTTQRLSELGKNFSVPLEPEELFLSIAGSVGKPIITKIKCCIHDGFVYFPTLTQDRRFLYYIFSSGQPYVGLGKLGTQLNLNTETVGNITIGLPPLPEQQAIVRFLDRETSSIDGLIEKKRRFIGLLREKRLALVTSTIGKGLDPKIRMKHSGVEWLGEIPEHWTLTPLKYLSPLTVGIVVNPSEFVSDEGLPYIYGGEIREGVIDIESARRISKEDSDRHEKTKLQTGDLLTVRVGAPGVTAVVPPECEGGNCASVMLIRKGEFSSQWLCYAMNSRVVRYQVEVVQYGAAQEQFNISHAVDFLVPTPPHEEQIAMVNELDRETARIDALISKTEQSIALLKERRLTLIGAAVTGKIDVRVGVAV